MFTLAALPLVDKIGRRKLMLLGASGLTLIYVLIAAAYGMGICWRKSSPTAFADSRCP
ncbi:MAG: MFS transporter [Klebsiella michiganensis]|nr:MFS transporter [Klebsiella michiganensis]